MKEIKMAEQQETVYATILNIGELEQITPKFSKADFEYQVAGNDDVRTADVPHWHRGALVEGNTYELVLKARQRDDGTHYTPMISEKPVLMTGDAVNGTKPTPPATPAKKAAPAPVVNKEETPAPTPGRRPELNARWVQFSTHSRTAQMQATERVGQMIQLAIAGRLVTDSDEPIKNLRKATIEDWYRQEVDRYWEELEMREPNDVFGNLKDGFSW
jgi:hypothetical protein